MKNNKKYKQAFTFSKKNQVNIYLRRKFLSFLFFTILLFPISKDIKAIDSLGFKLDKILFFESGKEIPVKQDRIYINYFKPEAKYINIELNIINLKYKIKDQEYNITFIWRYLNGSEYGRSETTLNIKSDWEKAYINKGWGWADKGNWPLGRFTAQIFINDNLFAEKDFFVNLDESEFLIFPQIKQEIKTLNNIHEGIGYQIIQQYQIDPYFNSYYKIEFSEDGKDIAYRLSHFEEHEQGYGYQKTETTTRNVYLFRNNKQIIPIYFIIYPDFDNNLKNLHYTGIRSTSNNNNNNKISRYYYYNGIQVFKSKGYASPDNKKYTYIDNSMPALKSSFTWDAAFEYLMINKQKVQPGFLSKAQVINITKPFVYIRNQDSSYNVVYTAKYKIDKQTRFALFNEIERISPEYNGYIGKPHLYTDEKRVAYVVENEKEWFVMINDKRITKGYDKINDEIFFCESGNNIIYQAKIKGDWYVMKGDEKISDGFANIETVVLNLNESNIAYKGKSGKKWSVFIDKTKISPDFDYIGEEIIFSPDGNKVAYAAGINNNMFVMINNQKISLDFNILHQYSTYLGKGPLAITDLIFNKTGDKIAYMVNISSVEGDIIIRNEQNYIMINSTQVSPAMYSTSIISKKAGELIYAGIDISDLILHHVKIDF